MLGAVGTSRATPSRTGSTVGLVTVGRLFDTFVPMMELTGEELESLLGSAKDIYPHYYPLVLFLADTGARLVEAIALRWTNLDLETEIVGISRSYSMGRHLGPTRRAENGVSSCPHTFHSFSWSEGPTSMRTTVSYSRTTTTAASSTSVISGPASSRRSLERR